ncbi:hypothetical protein CAUPRSCDRAFT_10630 [Caulochytrium protostelioides]|uniref:Secreted protein n=1 Tax=Caulochytrium protostelioides TaxID=1555241 RepID=A0A4P9X1J6_9FUNG|nr:hypothetical protein CAUPRSCDRAFT_10630 [Caulochytrium protostelioides]
MRPSTLVFVVVLGARPSAWSPQAPQRPSPHRRRCIGSGREAPVSLRQMATAAPCFCACVGVLRPTPMPEARCPMSDVRCISTRGGQVNPSAPRHPLPPECGGGNDSRRSA